MRLYFSILIFALTQTASGIWPIPTAYEHGNKTLWIANDFRVQLWILKDTQVAYSEDSNDVGPMHLFDSFQDTFQKRLQRRYSDFVASWVPSWIKESISSTRNSEHEGVAGYEIIQHAGNQLWTSLFATNFVPWKFHSRCWQEPQPPPDSEEPPVKTILLALLKEDPMEDVLPTTSTDESYNLTVPATGNDPIRIFANTTLGLAHGIRTLAQLFYSHTNTSTLRKAYTTLAPVTITDVPLFPHRGLNLDVARHWYPVADIKRTISALAATKLNRLHLHITDSQSWPLDIPSLPALAAKGAHHPSLLYTAADFRDIQHWAALNGVQVITEIDMPGHTSAVAHAYPELVAAFDEQPWWGYAAEPPAGTLKLNSSGVEEFLGRVLADVLPRVRPWSGYFHVGGDEVNREAYLLDETVRSNKVEVLRPLMQAFVERNLERVRGAGLTPVVWEEMLLEWDLELGEDVVVQSWRSDDAVRRIVEKGYKVLVGNYRKWVCGSFSFLLQALLFFLLLFALVSVFPFPFLFLHTLWNGSRLKILTLPQYLDCGKGQWLDFPSTSPSDYLDYCAPFHNWRAIYTHDPLANIPPEHHHLVLGGETHLWSEQSDPENMDAMLWPRAAAAAEVLWSGSGNGEREFADVSTRLAEMRERLVGMGVRAEPVQMPYCTMGGGCGWKG